MAAFRKPQRAHTLPPTTPLSQQVGGHAGVHVTEDESLLLKPTMPREIAFYQFVRDVADPTTGLHALKDWIPKFFGMLNLEGKLANSTADVDPGSVPAVVPVNDMAGSGADGNGDDDDSNAYSQTLVLQNLLYGYNKPCVLDVKLGTVLYDDDASDEKKARMIKKAAETTTLQTGVRLTGFQVYSNHSPDPIVYGKAYGYSLKPERLQDGIRDFFPCSTQTLPTNDLNAGPERSTALDSNAGLPVDTLLILLTSLHDSLSDLRETLSRAHVRIVGGSVLIIYEGDWERATAASGRGGGPNSLDDPDGNEDEGDEDDEIEVEVDERGELVMECLPDGTSDTSSLSSYTDSNLQPRLYTISLIDFAHTRVVPGEGPDLGVLKGMDTLMSLVHQRRQEVEALKSLVIE